MKRSVGVVGLVWFLASCAEEVKTVTYYKEHEDERVAKLAVCKDTGDQGSRNCITASRASSELKREKFNKPRTVFPAEKP